MVGTNNVVWVSVKETQDMQINGQNYSELEELGEKVFIPFPKRLWDMEKCKRWLVACSREFFCGEKHNKKHLQYSSEISDQKLTR